MVQVLRDGCAHMRQAFDIESINLDDLISDCVAAVERLFVVDDGNLLRETLQVLKESFGSVQGRTATVDCAVEGVQFRKGDPVALFLTAAGRDPLKWPDADQFDIQRKGANLGFGAGIHLCLGQALARMEFAAIFDAILRHVDQIEPAGMGRRFINNAAVGWASLPVRLTGR